MDFPSAYGPRPAWHDIQAEVRGPAVHDLEHTFRERWYGSSVAGHPEPAAAAVRPGLPRQRDDRPAAAGAAAGRPDAARQQRGAGAADVPGAAAPVPVRTARRAQHRARLPPGVRARQAAGLPGGPVPVVTRRRQRSSRLPCAPTRRCTSSWWCRAYSDREGRFAEAPARVGREDAVRLCSRRRRGQVRDVRPGEPRRHAGVRAREGRHRRRRVGDDRLGQPEPPLVDPRQRAVRRGARRAARRPRAGRPGRPGRRCADLRPRPAAAAVARAPRPAGLRHRRPARSRVGVRRVRRDRRTALRDWYDGGQAGPRPPGRVLPNTTEKLSRRNRLWADPVYRALYDPDGRPWRDRLRRRT